ncbi:hypothetical protein PBY51_009973 [Eleginops maclovinus]|uniref:Uncharacterized protein n=1 Tax=Eleginops maclovinus TaxID=56733 RepID=A0AAN8AUB6_ELEMC|nr:hypothetical protein PBY51_009973 [Eleginops maclovinus]
MSRSQCPRPPSHHRRKSERGGLSDGDVGSVVVLGEGKAVNSERAGERGGGRLQAPVTMSSPLTVTLHSPKWGGCRLPPLPPKKH